MSNGSTARRLLGVAIVLFSLLSIRPARAYAWMIRHDYASCATCHVDPSGAGVLTAYGRAQSEVLLRTRWGAVADDEDPAKLGGFLFGAVALPESLLLQTDVRSLFLHVRPPKPAPATTRVILMQADTAAALAAGPLRASAMLGYAHEGALAASVSRGEEDRLVSRQHWLGVAFGKDDPFLLRAGRLNVPFGLRMIEHTLLTRVATRSDINAAQQHGIAFAWNQDGWRAEAMAIVGNFQVSPDALRERGASAYVERAFSPALAAGVTSKVTHARIDLETQTSTFQQAHGIFGRYAIAKSVVALGELDLLVRSPKRRAIDVGGTGFVQVDFEPTQGLHLAPTLELATHKIRVERPEVGGWLSAWWFFLPHVDIRGDVIFRSVPTAEGRATVTTFLAQLHGWL